MELAQTAPVLLAGMDDAIMSQNADTSRVAENIVRRDDENSQIVDMRDADHLVQGQHSEELVGVVPVVEETVQVGKRAIEQGRVRVSTRTETIEEIRRESLRTDAVGVTRVPIDRIIGEGETAPQVRTEAGITIIPVLEEVLVVEKRLLLKEEVHIQRTTSGEEVEVPVTLRRQQAVIERDGPNADVSQPTSTLTPETHQP